MQRAFVSRLTYITPPVRHVRSAMWVRDRTRDGSNCVYVCTTFKFPTAHQRSGGPFSTVGDRRDQIKLTHYVCGDPHVILGPSRDQLICAIPTPVSQEAAPAGEALNYVALLAGRLSWRLSGAGGAHVRANPVVSERAVFAVMRKIRYGSCSN